jgi:HSP20 family molecular chaperone IbpA
MASFFEKLKKGMGVDEGEKTEELKEETVSAENEKEAEVEEKEIQPQKSKKKPKQKSEKKEQEEEKQTEEKKEMPEEKEEKTAPKPAEKENKESWSNLSKEPEGQLAIDVYQTENELVLQSAIAGVKPESLDISIEGDMVTIRGTREKPQEKEEASYFYQECFWGPFSRQIILSVEVDPSRTEASLKDGILMVRIPKIERERKRKIVVKG